MNIASIGKSGFKYAPSAIKSSSAGKVGDFSSMLWDEWIERNDVDNIKISHKDQGKSIEQGITRGRFLTEIDGSTISVGFFEAKDSTEEDPIVIAAIENREGEIYREQIHVKDVDPTYATFFEMEAVIWSAPEGTFDWGASGRLTTYFDRETCFERQDYMKMIQNTAKIELDAGQLEVGEGFVNLFKGYEEYCKQKLSKEVMDLNNSREI